MIVRHRWIAAAASTAVLLVLVAAAATIQLGNPRADSLSQSGPARVGLENLQSSGIGTGPLTPFDALVRSGDPEAVAETLRKVDGVQNVVAPADWRRDGTAIVVAFPAADGSSAEGRATLDRIRATALPGQATIGGEAAQSADFIDAVYSKFPYLIALICLLTFVLLARAFRSLLLPLKAVLLNLLSVAAAWGLLVLVFQKGYGSGDLGHRGDAGDQRRVADRRLRVPVRHLDGLPGVHHQPHARGIRPHGLDGDRRRRGDRPDRPPRDQRRAHLGARVRRVQHDARNRGEDVLDLRSASGS